MPDLDTFALADRVAIVTGGTRGIGRAISIGFADVGADVVPTSRSPDAVEAAVDEVQDRGASSLVCPTDVTDSSELREIFEETASRLGEVDIVVNNAGINPDAALGRPEEIRINAFDETIAVNLRGAFECAAIAGEYLVDNGALINIASVGGLVGLPRQHPYIASKHGLVGLTKSLALDWAPDIRVNAIAPGYVRTEMTAGVLENDRLTDSILDRTPLDRFAHPDEIAGPAVFLASDAASFVTGTCLVVDGGWTTR